MTNSLDIYYNNTTERSVAKTFKGGTVIIISTKERIKKEALSLFAKKGYYGTSINDIADAVGITKSSFYSHYSGKDELFLAVTEEVVHEHEMLFERLLEASKNMEVQDMLRYNFEKYILYFYRNPEIHGFSSQSLFFVPPELREKLRPNYLIREKHYRKRVEDIFEKGMQQGIIRKGNPVKKVWSFKTKRDGVLVWMRASPDLNEECIEEFWNDYWFGIMEKNEAK